MKCNEFHIYLNIWKVIYLENYPHDSILKSHLSYKSDLSFCRMLRNKKDLSYDITSNSMNFRNTINPTVHRFKASTKMMTILIHLSSTKKWNKITHHLESQHEKLFNLEKKNLEKNHIKCKLDNPYICELWTFSWNLKTLLEFFLFKNFVIET